MATRKQPAKTEKSLTLADVTVRWTDDTGHEREIRGEEIAYQLSRLLFFARDAGHTPLWQSRIRGLSALLFPDAGISIYDEDGRALASGILHEAAAGIEAERLDLTTLARGFVITPRRGRP